MNSARILTELPDTFRFNDAVALIGEGRFRRLLADGHITRLAHGLYRKADWIGDEDLVAIVTRAPRATLALRSALARHDLIDDIPSSIDIAIPRGAWVPKLEIPVRWHRFDATTFDIGRDDLDIDQRHSIGVYSAQRSIVDAFRLRHLEGEDLGIESLKRWLRQGGQPSELLRLAKSFPTAQRGLNQTISILL